MKPLNPTADSKNNKVILFLILFAFLAIICSCDESFKPLKENETSPFSIYGFIDSSADTQWIRVIPLRELREMPDEIPDMKVSLENLESGHTIQLKDSLILLRQNINAVVVWTEEDIQANSTYRLRAERPDGAASIAQVSLPAEFPTPTVRVIDDNFYRLFIEGVENLADVQTRWHVRIQAPDSDWDFESVFWIGYRSLVTNLSSDVATVRLSLRRDRSIISSQIPTPPRGELIITSRGRQIYVAAGGPEWDDSITSLSDILYTLPDVSSNVENGIGYFIGVTSKAIPYESCSEGFELIPCEVVKPLW